MEFAGSCAILKPSTLPGIPMEKAMRFIGLGRRVLLLLSLLAVMPPNAFGTLLGFDEIRSILDANPPATGDPVLREQAILDLDEYLKEPDAVINPEVHDFYDQMMANLVAELAQPVPTGARLWQMYNHGYIVKTPSSIFSFDLIDAGEHLVPNEVIQQIDVAFVSHEHGDHWGRPSEQVASSGGEMVSPLVFSPGSVATIGGLEVAAYFGLHSVDNNIYHVTTPEGLTIMHTGDTQHSGYVPDDAPTEILLINAWMNENGIESATLGVRNGINRVSPILTIPGHIQELGHEYNPQSNATRVPYEWALAVDDVPIPGTLGVMAWGEHYDYSVVPEPSTLTVLGMAGAGLLAANIWRKRRRRPSV